MFHSVKIWSQGDIECFKIFRAEFHKPVLMAGVKQRPESCLLFWLLYDLIFVPIIWRCKLPELCLPFALCFFWVLVSLLKISCRSKNSSCLKSGLKLYYGEFFFLMLKIRERSWKQLVKSRQNKTPTSWKHVSSYIEDMPKSCPRYWLGRWNGDRPDLISCKLS